MSIAYEPILLQRKEIKDLQHHVISLLFFLSCIMPNPFYLPLSTFLTYPVASAVLWQLPCIHCRLDLEWLSTSFLSFLNYTFFQDWWASFSLPQLALFLDKGSLSKKIVVDCFEVIFIPFLFFSFFYSLTLVFLPCCQMINQSSSLQFPMWLIFL